MEVIQSFTIDHARVARQSRVVIFINGLQSCITTAYIPAAFLQKIE